MSTSYFCALNAFFTSFSDCRYVLATNTRPRPTARDCQNQNKENILFTNLSCITTGKGSHGRAFIKRVSKNMSQIMSQKEVFAKKTNLEEFRFLVLSPSRSEVEAIKGFKANADRGL